MCPASCRPDRDRLGGSDHAVEHLNGKGDLTLLTALDIPWQPDGLQRDGVHVREPVDALLRSALQGHGLAYAVVGGLGPARLAAALAAAERARGMPSSPATAPTLARWLWRCERCGDADCERHLLPRP